MDVIIYPCPKLTDLAGHLDALGEADEDKEPTEEKTPRQVQPYTPEFMKALGQT